MKKHILTVVLIAIAFASCDKNDMMITPAEVNNAARFYPAPPAKWFGGAKPYFTPAGFVGDVMPYFEKDSFHVFYLHDARDGTPGFHPWSKFTTTNLTDYTYNGVMIPFGSTTDYDIALGTGSVIKIGNTYYAYYSGFNDRFNGTGGKYRDNTLLATSTDLTNWKKVPGFIMKPETTNGYNQWEYRDPYVFFNTEKNEYWMLVTGRKDNKAAVMLYTTTTPANNNWQLKDPVYTTSDYNVPETPQMLKWGNYWYLIFSENSVENTTRYRISSSSSGPWITPANDKLDGQYMYASKIASNGTDTYLFGWSPTKSGSSDAGFREFGGNLVVHKLMQNTDGTLSVLLPTNIEKLFTKQQTITPVLKEEKVNYSGTNAIFGNGSNEQYLVFDKIAGSHLITATISNMTADAKVGLVFGMDKALQRSSFFKIELNEKDNTISGLSVVNGNTVVNGKVNVALEPGKDYQLKAVINGSVCVVYINDKVALTSRIYAIDNNLWGLYAKGGATISNITMKGN